MTRRGWPAVFSNWLRWMRVPTRSTATGFGKRAAENAELFQCWLQLQAKGAECVAVALSSDDEARIFEFAKIARRYFGVMSGMTRNRLL